MALQKTQQQVPPGSYPGQLLLPPRGALRLQGCWGAKHDESEDGMAQQPPLLLTTVCVRRRASFVGVITAIT